MTMFGPLTNCRNENEKKQFVEIRNHTNDNE